MGTKPIWDKGRLGVQTGEADRPRPPSGDLHIPVLDASTLRHTGRNLGTPFLVHLFNDAGQHLEIQCVHLVRLLPRKRLVAVASLAGEQLLLKLFFGTRARMRMQREVAGLHHLQRLEIATPCFRGRFSSGDGIYGLALDYYPGAVDLRQAWQGIRAFRDRLDMIFRVVALMADMHAKGVLQRDVHLGNWLLAGGRLLAIDGDQISSSRAPCKTQACFRNLAEFHAQLPPAEDQLLKLSWPAYCTVRRWQADRRRDLARLETLVKLARKKHLDLLKDKCLRNSTRHVSGLNWRCRYAARRQEPMTFLSVWKHPDKLFDGAALLKNGRTATVARFSWGGGCQVVKRYKVQGVWHWLRLCFLLSPARRSWQNSHLLESLGIQTIAPDFFLERRLGPLHTRSYLVYPFIPSEDARTVLSRADKEDRPFLIQSLMNMLLCLRGTMVSHGDLRATSILMTERGPLLLDMDAVVLYSSRRRFARAFGKDISRFLSSFADYPELLLEVREALEIAGLLQQDRRPEKLNCLLDLSRLVGRKLLGNLVNSARG